MSRQGDFLRKTSIKRQIRAHILERDGWQCHYCRRPFGDASEVTLDHYVPWSLWRMSKPRNLVAACEPCNLAKADSLPWPLAVVLLQTAGLAA